MTTVVITCSRATTILIQTTVILLNTLVGHLLRIVVATIINNSIMMMVAGLHSNSSTDNKIGIWNIMKEENRLHRPIRGHTV